MIVFLLLFLTTFSEQKSSFIPPNNIHIPVDSRAALGVNETEYHQTLDKFEAIYKPIVAAHHRELVIDRLWEESELNAEAVQMNGKWIIKMYGGFARYRTMDQDSLMLVACHEMGHHLGGAPRFSSLLLWSSVEGQSDYFTTSKCLRRVWENDNNPAIISKMKIPPALNQICTENWDQTADQALCIRSGMASLNMTGILAFIGRKPTPRVDKPVLTGVTETKQRHNSPQCRLDTFIQGSICRESHLKDFSSDSEVPGSCHRSLGHDKGLRPRCWFKPNE